MNLKDVITKSQRTQRNWDLTKTINKEDLDLFKIAVSQCPTKQNRNWYNVVFISDRNKIEQIYNTTDGFTYEKGKTTTNSQTLANLLVVFCADIDSRDKINSDTTDNSISIGIAAAYLNLTAHMLNYKTGFCACFKNGEVDKIINDTNSMLILGIGHADEKKDRKEHHLNKGFLYPSFNKNVNIRELK